MKNRGKSFDNTFYISTKISIKHMSIKQTYCMQNGVRMKKTIITVVGKDKVGIIANICTYLANNRVNILDISQTIVQGYFNMMMIVDSNNSPKNFEQLATELEQIGEEIGVIIKTQHEDIFNKMHRL